MEINKRKVSPDEYKRIVLDLLKRIHQICEDNNIRYTIAFGTVLGAVRHQGFIPWDDDVDICLPREDYNKFVKAFSSEDGRYYILDSKTSKNYYNNFSRACDRIVIMSLSGIEDIENLGAYVDVFVLDKWPEALSEREEYHRNLVMALKRVRYALPWKNYRTCTFRGKMKILFHFHERIINRVIVGLRKRKEEQDALLIKYANTKSKWRNYCSGFANTKATWLLREEDLDRRILMKFEDTKVYVPAEYDRLLREQYGDYMTPPPLEKRISKHHFTPYWRE